MRVEMENCWILFTGDDIERRSKRRDRDIDIDSTVVVVVIVVVVNNINNSSHSRDSHHL